MNFAHILVIFFLIEGQPQPLTQPVPMPDMKTCEKQAHLINTHPLPRLLKGQQVNGMGAMCLRVKPQGKDV